MSDLTRRDVLRMGTALALGTSAGFAGEDANRERRLRQDPGVEVLSRNVRELLAGGDMIVLLAGPGPDARSTSRPAGIPAGPFSLGPTTSA